MKITNAFLESANLPQSQSVALSKLFQCTSLPPKISYWLSRLLSQLESLNKTYAAERKKLIEKWCDKDDAGNPILVDNQYKLPVNPKEFSNDFAELLSIELTIDINPIEIQLDKIPDGVLNSYDYVLLSDIIVFKEE